jgi:hypothetical protein
VPLPFVPGWREARERDRRTRLVVDGLRREPDEADVEWLADAAANGDRDHARTALGLIVAQRDALDDRTAADLSHACVAALDDDPRIATDLRDLAERQFNERLQAYREAMLLRGGTLQAADRVGRCLLAFASDGARTAGAPLAYAIELLQRYADEAGELLRSAYGEASLPEDVKPSVLRDAR